MTRPDYIARGGDLVMSQPLALHGATMYSFLIGADLGALRRMCETQLDPVANGAFVYRPLLPMAAVVCADITRSWSLTPPDSEKGWMAERDFGIWVPLAAGTEDAEGRFHVDRIGWYLPYVFVDNVAAMVTGRDVYGFFKQTAALAMPPSPTSEGSFTTDALVIERFSPESTASTVRLLEVTPADGHGAPAPAGGRPWGSALEALEAMLGDLRRLFFDVEHAGPLPVPSWELVKTLLADAIHGLVPMIFLKQLRDVEDPTKACYQAVIEAPSKLQAWHGGGLVHPHDVTILPCDSHPIARDLGLAGATVRAELGFWTQMDFVMEAGKVVAER
jgi:hypothetical protein